VRALTVRYRAQIVELAEKLIEFLDRLAVVLGSFSHPNKQPKKPL
jgi:hypothetical protein